MSLAVPSILYCRAGRIEAAGILLRSCLPDLENAPEPVHQVRGSLKVITLKTRCPLS